MKYRIKLVLIICSGEEILLVRDSNKDKYRLPFHMLQKTHQVDQAIRDFVASQFELTVTEVSVNSVANSTSRNSGGGSLDIICEVRVDAGDLRSTSGAIWQAKTQQLGSITKPDAQILRKVWGFDGVLILDSVPFTSSDQTTHVVYSDGGSRGNPGHSAAAFVVYDNKGVQLMEGGEYLGITTSTIAEYLAVKLALEAALSLGAKQLECRIDNSTVVNQMNAVYVVKNRDLWPIHENIIELVKQFERVSFSHVSRELNTRADALVNQTLDKFLNN